MHFTGGSPFYARAPCFTALLLCWSLLLACADRATLYQLYTRTVVYFESGVHEKPAGPFEKLCARKQNLPPDLKKETENFPTCRLGSECYFCLSAVTMPVSCL